MYVWGLAETGALGLHQPRGKRGQKDYKNDFKFAWHPVRSSFAERFDVSFFIFFTKFNQTKLKIINAVAVSSL